MYVTSEEFSRVIHGLGLKITNAEPGLLHDESKGGTKHTVFRVERGKGPWMGEIIADGINPVTHHINERLIPNYQELLRKRSKKS